MTPSEAITFHKRARRYALAVTRDEDTSDDIAQDVITSWLEYERTHGTRTRQTIRQAVIECIRARIGREHTARSLAYHNSTQYMDNAHTTMQLLTARVLLTPSEWSIAMKHATTDTKHNRRSRRVMHKLKGSMLSTE